MKAISRENLEMFKSIAKTDRLGGQGFLVITDSKTGNIVRVVSNKVVFRGRLFVLEKLFNMDIDPTIDPTFQNDRNRKIAGFKIGSGGVIAGETTPREVGNIDKGLADRKPFRVIDTNVGMPTLTELEKNQYFDEESAAGIHYYYAKAAASVVWQVDPDTNMISMVTTVEVTEKDARDTSLNEVGIYLANVNTTGPHLTYSNLEMFSAVTFKTIPIEMETVFKLEYHLFVI